MKGTPTRSNSVFGDVPVALTLSAPLASIWHPPLVEQDKAPAAAVELAASDALHPVVRWFDDPDGDNPNELRARGCRLLRSTHSTGERISGTCHPTETAIRHALRFGTQPALLRRGWLLVHACAVELSDGVHAFAGTSGVGKSTFARRAKAAGHRVLCEELVLVTAQQAAAHPAQPLVIDTASKPLAALHFIAQGEPNRRRLSPAQACARLLSLVMVYERSDEASRLALSSALRIVESSPAFETTVPDNERALSVLREAHR